MTSYLRSWLAGVTPAEPPPPPRPSSPAASINVLPPQAEDDDNDDDDDDDGSDTETERRHDDNADSDSPPAFPSLSSAQRVKPSKPLTVTDSERMPPPPVPSRALPSTSSLGVPATTTKPAQRRQKVALKPGHGPLDWAKIKTSGADLRGVDTLMRIPPSVLKQHSKRDDAWSAIHGKVYNITPYLDFHPGGDRELMRVAGRDGTKLFTQTHAWINVDLMLDACLVGFLIPEPSS